MSFSPLGINITPDNRALYSPELGKLILRSWAAFMLLKITSLALVVVRRT